MNFLQKYERKFFPNTNQIRYNLRKQKSLLVQKKCLLNPTQITDSQLRNTLRVLKYYKLIPADQNHEKLETKAIAIAMKSCLVSLIISALPFGIREIYKMRIFYKVICSTTVFTLSYIVQVYEIYRSLNEYNRKILLANIHKLTEETEYLEQDEQIIAKKANKN